MQNHVHALHALIDEVALRDRSLAVREGRTLEVETRGLMVRVLQGSHEGFAQVAGAAGDEALHRDCHLYNVRSETNGNTTPITNFNAAISSDVAGHRLLVKSGNIGSTALWRPDIPQPEEYL
jgi:hypothetical protein